MKKVLVVDDEENICRLYREELEEMGYEVTTVQDGSSAIAALEKTRYDSRHPRHAHEGHGRH